MKVLHTESSLGWGGQELRIGFDVWHLNQQPNHTCKLLCDVESQFETRTPWSIPLIKSRLASKNIFNLWKLCRILIDEAPDCVATHSSTDSWLVALARLFVKPKFKIVRYRHVSAPISKNASTRWLYRQADSIITTSEAIRQILLKQFQIDPKSVISIPTGVDTTYFSAKCLKKLRNDKLLQGDMLNCRRILLMVSTLRSWKGHEFAIKALRYLPEWTLWIVGDGPQLDNLNKLVVDLKLQSQVVFFGHQNDVRHYLASADIFLQPSYANEGVSQAVLQAMACEIPVIAGDIAGLNEVVMDRLTGLLVAPRDELAIARAVKLLELKKVDRDTLSKNAKALVLEKYNQVKLISATHLALGLEFAD